jgi:lipopolysaccharide/colanic/teichoic acid biosynthesis glycosyltransferase/glycosyltransferase involved in cell wall biosynthesis
MRILMLTQWFEPERTTRGLMLARALVERGHHVEVLTGVPNYPGGAVFPGYSALRLPFTETMDGVRITRVPLYPSHNRSPLRRAANYLSFAASASLFSGRVAGGGFDVIHAFWPAPTIGIPAAILAARTDAPFVVEIQDLWPDTVAASGMLGSPAALRVIDRYCDWVYRRASAITVISDGFRRVLVERGVPQDRVHVVPNWCDDAAAVRAPRDPALAAALGLPPDRFIVMFAGTMGTAQGLDSVIDAARRARTSAPGAHFVFIGGGVERPRLEQLATQLDNVTFLPAVPADRMPPILALADALLVHLRDQPLFSVTVPAKTQSSLASGRPVIMAVRGDAAELVQQAGAGLICPPEDPDALVRAVNALQQLPAAEREAMGQRGATFYHRQLSITAGVPRFEQAFEAAIATHRARRTASAPVARRPRSRTGRLRIKRLLDVIVSATGLVVLAPVMVLIAIAIRITMGGPVLFRQRRPGLVGIPFTMVKFRTMRCEDAADGSPLPDGARLTPFGTWLRRYSLDELPELWNVLAGDMSLVGPRPLLTRYTPFFTRREQLRLMMRPGITGLAQVHGRNEVDWTRRLAYDVEYVERWGLGLDMRILWQTVGAVLASRGVVPDANTIMLDLDQERSSSRGAA